MIGEKTSGMTSLLNRMLGLEKTNCVALFDQFQEDPSRAGEGIWIWTVPIYNDLHHTNIFFLELTGVEPGHPDYSRFMAVFTLICSSFVVVT